MKMCIWCCEIKANAHSRGRECTVKRIALQLPPFDFVLALKNKLKAAREKQRMWEKQFINFDLGI